MRARWVVIFTAGIILSGCLAAEPETEPDKEPRPVVGVAEAPMPERLTFNECHHQEGFFQIPAPVIDDFLPEGFQLRPIAEGVPVYGVFVTAFACETATTHNASFTQPAVAWIGFDVIPPPELENDSIDLHAVLGVTMLSVPEVTAIFDTWSQGAAHNASIELIYNPLQGGEPRLGRVLLSGYVPLVLETQIVERLPPRDVLRARFYGVEDGEFMGAMDLAAHNHEFLRGAAELRGGDLLSGIFVLAQTPLGIGWHGPIGTMDFTWTDLSALQGSSTSG